MSDYMNMDTLRFQLNEVLGLGDLLKFDRFEDWDSESVDIFLDAVKDFADQDLYPAFREMDEDPARWEDGKIIVHPVVEKLMRKSGELGLISGPFAPEHGGMMMPAMVLQAAYFIMESANNNAPGYPGLTSGSANLIIAYGSQHLKDTFLPNMLEGKWAGTMCLTEPQAGSSLSDVTSTAYPQEDGSYKVKGQKIFISGGDHEFCENFVHLFLGRIEGAPKGTKGISLFVVPKNRVEADGSLAFNDVISAGDFQKVGQRGYCTTHLSFGEKDDCRAWIVGEPNRGLKYMFQMMNEARIAVGRGGVSVSSAAYHASLQYARERPQGRRISNTGKKNPDAEQTLIINHPDVRRMLLLQKSVYEGALSLILRSAKYHDLSQANPSEEKWHMLLELLTPVTKTYPAEMGQVAVSNGLQVLGGYGFCSEFVLQQYYRDIRIMSIYEGTTGIQSMDLLGRKVTMNGGAALQALMGEVSATIASAKEQDNLKPYAEILESKLGLMQSILQKLMPIAMSGKYERFLSDANMFMEMFGILVVAWQWLEMSITAQKALDSSERRFTKAFYESKIHTMKFFFKYEIPKTSGLAEILKSDEVLTILEEQAVEF